jgi:hypothetical protein
VPIAYVGAAELTAREIVERLNPYGLHFAFLDPYNLDDLPFTVIESFSRLKRIDMLIHVSAGFATKFRRLRCSGRSAIRI